jgi:hypothetical protein
VVNSRRGSSIYWRLIVGYRMVRDCCENLRSMFPLLPTWKHWRCCLWRPFSSDFSQRSRSCDCSNCSSAHANQRHSTATNALRFVNGTGTERLRTRAFQRRRHSGNSNIGKLRPVSRSTYGFPLPSRPWDSKLTGVFICWTIRPTWRPRELWSDSSTTAIWNSQPCYSWEPFSSDCLP